MTWIVNINLTQRPGGRCRMFPWLPARCLLRGRFPSFARGFPYCRSLFSRPLLFRLFCLFGLRVRFARRPRSAGRGQTCGPAVKPCPPPGWRKKAADRWFGAGLKWCSDLINQVVTFLYRIIGNEKVTVYFQLVALKYRISNNLLQDTKNFWNWQIVKSC